jgi:hypothetical protein
MTSHCQTIHPNLPSIRPLQFPTFPWPFSPESSKIGTTFRKSHAALAVAIIVSSVVAAVAIRERPPDKFSSRRRSFPPLEQLKFPQPDDATERCYACLAFSAVLERWNGDRHRYRACSSVPGGRGRRIRRRPVCPDVTWTAASREGTPTIILPIAGGEEADHPCSRHPSS